MKVCDLINELNKCKPNAEIFLATDSEGNRFCGVDVIMRSKDIGFKKSELDGYIIFPDDGYFHLMV